MRRSPNETNWTELGRVTKLTRRRPSPPRGLRWTATTGLLQWERPVDSGNITHYRIYANSESNLVREVPAGQLFLQDGLEADRVFISAYNSALGLESAKILLDEAVSPPPGPPGPPGTDSDTVELDGETVAY